MNTGQDLRNTISLILDSVSFFIPEIILAGGIVVILCSGLILHAKRNKIKVQYLLQALAGFIMLAALTGTLSQWTVFATQVFFFSDMLLGDNIATYLKLLFDVGGLFTVLMSLRKEPSEYLPEYLCLILATILGAHLLVMSTNLVMVFLSLELISISSYVLAGFAFSKQAAEGSLKYFIFGSVASAIMLYGFSLLYGISGTINFSDPAFTSIVASEFSPLLFIAVLMSFAGFFYKIAAVPMHPWAPDIYEAATMPVVAFFSVVPKLAGMGILIRFTATIADSASDYNWQFIIGFIAIITLSAGNLSAIWQQRPKRLMAYSSIAQTGFLLVGIAAFLTEGIHFMLFYATAYLIANFLVFVCLQYFENKGIKTIEDFSGAGRNFAWPSIALLFGLISLTGLPPTGGFMAKIFIFSSLWKAWETTEKSILIWLFIIGLMNTVISLFYYLRIPYQAFLKTSAEPMHHQDGKKLGLTNFFMIVLVLLILLMFLQPNILMGWINRIKFVF